MATGADDDDGECRVSLPDLFPEALLGDSSVTDSVADVATEPDAAGFPTEFDDQRRECPPSPPVRPSCASPHSADDAVRRLESRLVSMCDRIWEKVAQVNEQTTILGSEVAVVKEHTIALGGAVATIKAGAVCPRPTNATSTLEAPAAQELAELFESVAAAQADMERRFPEALVDVRAEFGETVRCLDYRVGERFDAEGARAAHLEFMLMEQREAAQAELQCLQITCQARAERVTHDRNEALAQLYVECEHNAAVVGQELNEAHAQQRADWEHNTADVAQELERVRGERATLPRRVEQCEEALQEERMRGLGLDDMHRATQAGLQRLLDHHEVLHLALNALQERTQGLERDIKALHQDVGALRCEATASAEELPGLVLRRAEARCQADALQARSALRDTEQRFADSLDDVRTHINQALPRLESGLTKLAAAIDAALCRMDRAFEATEARNSERFKTLADEVAGRIEEEHMQHAAACSAIDRRLAEVEVRISVLNRWETAEDQQHTRYDGHLALQDQRLTAHEHQLQRLAQQCDTIPKALEARVDDVRAAAKQDITTSALALYQGEVRLWAKMALLGCHSRAASMALSDQLTPQPPSGPSLHPPGLYWDGVHSPWQLPAG